MLEAYGNGFKNGFKHVFDSFFSPETFQVLGNIAGIVFVFLVLFSPLIIIPWAHNLWEKRRWPWEGR